MKKYLISILVLVLSLSLFENIYAAEIDEKPNIIIDNGTGYTKASFPPNEEDDEDMNRSFSLNYILDQGIEAAENAIDDAFENETVNDGVVKTRTFIDSIKEFFDNIINYFKNLFNNKQE